MCEGRPRNGSFGAALSAAKSGLIPVQSRNGKALLWGTSPGAYLGVATPDLG